MLKLDVTDAAQVAGAVRTAESGFGRIDGFVNSAGYGYPAAIEESEEDEARAMFETDFSASPAWSMPSCREGERRCPLFTYATRVRVTTTSSWR